MYQLGTLDCVSNVYVWLHRLTLILFFSIYNCVENTSLRADQDWQMLAYGSNSIIQVSVRSIKMPFFFFF